MEILIIILVGAGLVYWMYRSVSDKPEYLSENKGIVASGEPPATVVEGGGVVSWHTAPPAGSKLAENTLDVNHDGKVDLDDVKEAVKKVRSKAKKAADVDGDGTVTKADAKAAVKKVAAKTKKTVGRKPKA